MLSHYILFSIFFPILSIYFSLLLILVFSYDTREVDYEISVEYARKVNRLSLYCLFLRSNNFYDFSFGSKIKFFEHLK